MKRLTSLLVSLLMLFLPLVNLGMASAAGTNLIANPSAEEVTGTAPTAWTTNKYGTNTTTFAHGTTAHTGGRGLTVNTTAFTGGDAKWVPNDVAVLPNTTYTFSDWYQGTVKSSIDAVITSTSGKITYKWLGDPAASATWKQVSYSFKTPADAAKVTFYHSISAKGQLTTDDYELTGVAAPTPPAPSVPVVAVTAPANNATVANTQTITATASDPAGIKNVQFKLDGVNIGTADTTAPYSASWDTKTATNGAHTLTAVATNKVNAIATATNVTVNVQNVVPTAPTVQITAPAADATVAGTQTVTATASDVQSVKNVQFKLDGVNLGTADTTAPYSANWNTTTATNGTHVLTAVATNATNMTTTSTAVTVNVQNVVPAPTVQITAPVAGTIVSGTKTITATASGTPAVKNVQFKLDGVNIGTADTTSPYSVSWNTTTATNGTHTLTAVATNTANTATTSTAVTVDVQNVVPTPPTVQITTPANNATVSGAQTVTATAGGTQAITSVQFKLNGANLGAADTTAPYSVAWDTAAVANGTHKLTAVATNSASLSTTAAEVTVTVQNVVVPPVTPPSTSNLIANPSVETATGTAPASWIANAWGTNTFTNTYETTGRTGSRSLKTTVSTYTDGDAKWYFAPVAVTPGSTYEYTNWYKSNIDTEVDIMVEMTNGTVQYYYMGVATASPSAWQKFTTQFVMPAGSAKATVFQAVAKVGYVQTDDFSFAPHIVSGFSRPLVSLTFDDGWRSIYANGLPALNKYGLVSTQYLLTDTIDYPDYMTIAMMQAFKDQGHEIASHTMSHTDLTTLALAQLTGELQTSQNLLRQWYGTGVAKNFASPYGAYNATTLNEIKKYYRSHRSTDEGYNSKDNFDIYNIRVKNMYFTTTGAEVQEWVNQAIATNTWLVLVYHEVGTTNEDPTYSVTPAALDQQLSIVKLSGVTVKTVDQALDEIVPQL